MVPAGGAGGRVSRPGLARWTGFVALAELPGVVGTLEREADISAWGGLQVAGFAWKAGLQLRPGLTLELVPWGTVPAGPARPGEDATPGTRGI